MMFRVENPELLLALHQVDRRASQPNLGQSCMLAGGRWEAVAGS